MMKVNRFSWLTASLMVIAATASAEPTRKSAYVGEMHVMLRIPDRFSDEVRSAMLIAPFATRPPVRFDILVTAAADSEPAMMMISMEHAQTEPLAFGCGRVALLADGRLYAQIDASPATQKPTDKAAGTTVELVDILVPRSVMLRMASAKLVEVQVCETEVVLVPDFQHAIATMYAGLDTGAMEDAPGSGESEGSGRPTGRSDFKSLGLGL